MLAAAYARSTPTALGYEEGGRPPDWHFVEKDGPSSWSRTGQLSLQSWEPIQGQEGSLNWKKNSYLAFTGRKRTR